MTQTGFKPHLEKGGVRNRKAFTLAEVMIVLAIVGIISAILIPIAINSAPDEDIMKFKKANNALGSALREVINSTSYYLGGDLGKMPDGSLVSDPKYFCSTLSDVLTTKKVSCSDDDLGYNSHSATNLPDAITFEVSSGVNIREYADCVCASKTSAGAEITLPDGSIIYTVSPKWHFGSLIQGETKRLFNLCSAQKRYKYICIDIDGIGTGENPFGYALRADGKLLYGKKAQLWTKAKIQQSDDSATPAYTPITSCNSMALALTPEDDSCDLGVELVPSPSSSSSSSSSSSGGATPEPEIECPEHCTTCSSETTCTACETDYILVGGNCLTCSSAYANCATCSADGKCASCINGYALDTDGTCKACSSLISNCSVCSSKTTCTTCASGYSLDGSTCKNNFDCSGNFLQIGSLCVTKYNMGDSTDTAIPTSAGVSVVNTDDTCGSKTDYTTKCCWKGSTSGSKCDATNGSYSGCNRTVCNWAAAKAICESYSPNGSAWRLPTSNEMRNWDDYNFTGTAYAGNNGLMLCDRFSGNSSAYCDRSTYCYGAYDDDRCNPYYVWSGTERSTSCASDYRLNNDYWMPNSNGYKTYAFSVRCVTSI